LRSRLAAAAYSILVKARAWTGQVLLIQANCKGGEVKDMGDVKPVP
jgi:hypothetical protein